MSHFKIRTNLFAIISFVVALFALSAGAQQANLLAPSLNFEGLKKLIVQKHITKVDDLVSHFPAFMLQNPVLVYESHGLNRNLVTPSNPRTILFNEDGSLIVAFTKNPGDAAIAAGADGVEVLNFNYDSGKYEMRMIVLNGSKIPFAKRGQEPQVNSATCLKCHGNNPRPIFQDYDAWPGVYGSFGFSGLAATGSVEFQNFEKFQTARPLMDRYKYLKPTRFVKSEDGWRLQASGYKYGATNVLFATTVQRNMEIRLAMKMLSNPTMNKFSNLLAYVGSDLNSCGNIRDRIKDVYAAWTAQASVQNAATELLAKIRKQVQADFSFKKSSFEKFNLASTSEDVRGVLSIPNGNLMGVKDPYYSTDTVAYENQVVLLEAIAAAFGLTVEDISTFPNAPSLGMTHIMRMGLYSDEQHLLGITQAMQSMNVFSLPRIENGCTTAKAAAIKEVVQLLVPTNINLFKPAMDLEMDNPL